MTLPLTYGCSKKSIATTKNTKLQARPLISYPVKNGNAAAPVAWGRPSPKGVSTHSGDELATAGLWALHAGCPREGDCETEALRRPGSAGIPGEAPPKAARPWPHPQAPLPALIGGEGGPWFLWLPQETGLLPERRPGWRR